MPQVSFARATCGSGKGSPGETLHHRHCLFRCWNTCCAHFWRNGGSKIGGSGSASVGRRSWPSLTTSTRLRGPRSKCRQSSCSCRPTSAHRLEPCSRPSVHECRSTPKEDAGFLEVDATHDPRAFSMGVLGNQITATGALDAAVAHRVRKARQSSCSTRPLLRHWTSPLQRRPGLLHRVVTPR